MYIYIYTHHFHTPHFLLTTWSPAEPRSGEDLEVDGHVWSPGPSELLWISKGSIWFDISRDEDTLYIYRESIYIYKYMYVYIYINKYIYIYINYPATNKYKLRISIQSINDRVRHIFKESLSKPRHRQFWLIMVDDLWLTFPHLNWCFAIMFGLNPPYWFETPCICWWIFPLKRCFIGEYRDVSKKMLRYLDLNFEAATQVICSREISQF